MISPERALSEADGAGRWARAWSSLRTAWGSLQADEGALALSLAKLRFVGRVRARPAVSRREVEFRLDQLLRRLDGRRRT